MYLLPAGIDSSFKLNIFLLTFCLIINELILLLSSDCIIYYRRPWHWLLHGRLQGDEVWSIHAVSTDRVAQDCTAGLDAGGLKEIPFAEVNQVFTPATQAGLYRGGPLYLYSSYTGRTVQGRAPLSVLTLFVNCHIIVEMIQRSNHCGK